MTTETTPHSGPILDLPTAVRVLGAVPMPAGPEPQRTMLDHAREALNARMTKDDLRLVLENTIAFAASLEKDREANDREYEQATARIAELEAAQGKALRRTVTWRLEVQENDCWWDCGQSADSYPAAQDLLGRERAEKPGIGFRLVCRTTTDTLPAEQQAASSYPPALPWARLMDDEDLSDFLDDLADAAGTPGSYEGALATVENAIARHRLIAEAQHAHNTAPGPNTEGGAR